jgi:DNA-binding transcriptional LysR family regulator
MDWQTINFDWNRVRAFLITAEEGSLTAAARALGTTQPTLGRQVSALEDELGAVLFDRVGGKLVLTENGKILLEHVRVMGEAAGHVSRLADGQSTEVQGKISISASEVYCAFCYRLLSSSCA